MLAAKTRTIPLKYENRAFFYLTGMAFILCVVYVTILTFFGRILVIDSHHARSILVITTREHVGAINAREPAQQHSAEACALIGGFMCVTSGNTLAGMWPECNGFRRLDGLLAVSLLFAVSFQTEECVLLS